MLAQNKSGWKLLEYLDIGEERIGDYENVTGAFAIINVGDKFLVGFNPLRQQWEFPAYIQVFQQLPSAFVLC